MRATAAMRLSGECPRCKSTLVRRTRKSDGNPFISCSGYPTCKFAEDWDPHVARLAADVDALRDEVSKLRIELNSQTPNKTDASVSKRLREVIAYAHPDRWPQAMELAHGVVSKLNALRGEIA